MKRHILSKEHGPFSAALKCLTKIAFHKCHVCGEIVLCDKFFIICHIRTHKLTLSVYCRNAKINDFENTKEVYLSKLQAYIEHIPIQKTRDKTVLNAKELPDELSTNHVGSISFFKCHLCHQRGMCFTSLQSHFKNQHGLKFLKYKPHMVWQARYHQCHICAQNVLCDNYFIAYHIKIKHKMKVPQYRQDYVLKKGFMVFPTLADYMRNNEVFESLEKDTNQDPCDKDNTHIMPWMLSSKSEESDKE